MEEKYYMFKGELNRNKNAEFFKSFFKQNLNTYELKEEIKNLLSKDEIMELTIDFLQMSQDTIGIMVPKTNLYVNITVTTITLLALILDEKLTKGIANFILTATGFNANSIVKLKEELGEKCTSCDGEKHIGLCQRMHKQGYVFIVNGQ